MSSKIEKLKSSIIPLYNKICRNVREPDDNPNRIMNIVGKL